MMEARGNRFKVVVPAYNCVKWIDRCLQSIEKQTYKDYEVCIVDDKSTDPLQRPAIKKIAECNGWSYVFNDKRKGALFNIVNAIRHLKCLDDDVIVLLDGDDWLSGCDVFKLLNYYYLRENIAVSYGHFVWRSNSKQARLHSPLKFCEGRPEIRKMAWQFSHLRTFKYGLWKNIADSDLRNSEGDYYEAGWDLAIMYPLIEMAGTHIKHVPEVLYVYNDVNPICDFRIKLDLQEEYASEIRLKPRYQLLMKGAVRRNKQPLFFELTYYWLKLSFLLKIHFPFLGLRILKSLKRRLITSR